MAARGAQRTRSTEYRALHRLLADPAIGGAVVLGGIGMGKTNLVDEVLADGWPAPVMSLYCTPSLSSTPHGALSAYLGDMADIQDPVAVLRELNRKLTAPPRNAGPRIVLVESAEYLDAQSCFVLSLLVQNAAVKLVAIGGAKLEHGSVLATLAETASLGSIELKALDTAGVRIVAEETVGRPLGTGAVRLVELASGGNPRIAKAYVASCLDQGLLFRDESLLHGQGVHDPVWIIARPQPQIDIRLRSLARELTRNLPEQEQATLRLLSLGGPQVPALLDECQLPYRRLLDAGELVLSDGSISFVSTLAPLLIRALATQQDSARLHARWSAAKATLGLECNASEVLWSLEIGVPVAPGIVLRLAEHAARQLDYSTALQLCTQGRLAEHSEQGALLEAHVLLGMGRHYAARALLLRLIDKLQDPDLLGQGFAYLLEVTTNIGLDNAQIASILETWKHRAEGLADANAAERFVQLQQAGAKILGLWARVNLQGGKLPQPAELREFLDDPDLPIQARIIAMVTLVDVLSNAGRCRDALELAEQTMAMLQDLPEIRALYELRVLFRIGWNLLFLGDYRNAAQAIEQYRGQRVSSIQYSQGAIALLDGISELLQGRVQSAITTIAEAVTELHVVDTAQLLATAGNLYRVLVARLGATVPEQVEFGGALNSWDGDSVLPMHLGEGSSQRRIFARAFAAVLGRPFDGESLQDFPLVGREILFSQTRQLGDEALAGSDAGARLHALAAAQQGSRAALLAQLIRLRAAPDPGPLEELADAALQKEEYLVVIEAWARAAERHAAAGDPRRCGALLRRTGRLLEAQSMDPGKYISRVMALTELTAREAVIVDLARKGMNNAQIARALTVSQRTVEGHLYRVFSKLGISERAELDEAVLDAGIDPR